MPGPNNAAGAQPGPLPIIEHLAPAPDHYVAEGRKARPKTKIVIHNTCGVNSAPWLSTTSKPPVSIHVLGRRNGVRTNIVNYRDVAWHVGNAKAGFWNSNCLGYEFESTNDAGVTGNGYTDAQYQTAAHCVATWLYSYDLDFDRDVVSHASIAIPVGRRHDPYAFDWSRFRLLTLAWLAFFRLLPNDAERSKYII